MEADEQANIDQRTIERLRESKRNHDIQFQEQGAVAGARFVCEQVQFGELESLKVWAKTSGAMRTLASGQLGLSGLTQIMSADENGADDLKDLLASWSEDDAYQPAWQVGFVKAVLEGFAKLEPRL